MKTYKVVIASNGNSVEPCEYAPTHIGVVERILDAHVVFVRANSSRHAKVVADGLIYQYTRSMKNNPRRGKHGR